MKNLLMIVAFTFSLAMANAQKTAATDTVKKSISKHLRATSKPQTKKTVKWGKKNLPAATAIHGGKVVSMYHGKHDYTPGSPVGTGGAGGNTLSGSPQGSAEENAMGNKASNQLLKQKKKRDKRKIDNRAGQH